MSTVSKLDKRHRMARDRRREAISEVAAHERRAETGSPRRAQLHEALHVLRTVHKAPMLSGEAKDQMFAQIIYAVFSSERAS